MQIIIFLGGFLLILFVLLDAFATVVLPRRVGSRFRFTELFYDLTWSAWTAFGRRLRSKRAREDYLAIYGPLALLLLLIFWAVGLTIGFALLYMAIQSSYIQQQSSTFWTDLYISATTLFPLGPGDETPHLAAARAILVIETGMGYAFLALVIGYLPLLYQAFAEREATITTMDARAGSPPTALEALRRCALEENCSDSIEFLADWEHWSSELLETHLSYPLLGFYRSQHENQSWLAALAVILDTSALVSLGIDGISKRQGRLTFAMARHTIVDLAQVYQAPPDPKSDHRLSAEEFQRMQMALSQAGMSLPAGEDVYNRLAELRSLYEPYLTSLSNLFMMVIPGWTSSEENTDNWESTAWAGSGRVRL